MSTSITSLRARPALGDRAAVEASLERSRRALPVQAAAALVLLGATWALQRWLDLPGWLACTAAVLSTWGVAGDAINVAWCRRALRRQPVRSRPTPRARAERGDR